MVFKWFRMVLEVEMRSRELFGCLNAGISPIFMALVSLNLFPSTPIDARSQPLELF